MVSASPTVRHFASTTLRHHTPPMARHFASTERIREPFLFIEGAEGEKEALTYLFANLPYAYKKLYGPRVVMIGAREKPLDFDAPEEFVAEFRDAECDYVLYRLDGNVTYRKPEN